MYLTLLALFSHFFSRSIENCKLLYKVFDLLRALFCQCEGLPLAMICKASTNKYIVVTMTRNVYILLLFSNRLGLDGSLI